MRAACAHAGEGCSGVHRHSLARCMQMQDMPRAKLERVPRIALSCQREGHGRSTMQERWRAGRRGMMFCGLSKRVGRARTECGRGHRARVDALRASRGLGGWRGLLWRRRARGVGGRAPRPQLPCSRVTGLAEVVAPGAGRPGNARHWARGAACACVGRQRQRRRVAASASSKAAPAESSRSRAASPGHVSVQFNFSASARRRGKARPICRRAAATLPRPSAGFSRARQAVFSGRLPARIAFRVRGPFRARTK
jgi:hypothetical protein